MLQDKTAITAVQKNYWKRVIFGGLLAEIFIFMYFQYDLNRYSDFYFTRCGEGMGAVVCTMYLYALFHWDLVANLAALYQRSIFEGFLMTLLSSIFIVP